MSLFDRRLLGREILPGYGYYLAVLAWMVFLLPWQVRELGDAQWSVVAFCLSLHALLFGLDLALAPLLLRAAGEHAEPRGIGLLYWQGHVRSRNYGIGLILLLGSILVIGYQFGLEAPLTLPAALLLAALFLFQIQNAVALAIWNGRGQQILASSRSALFLMIRQGFATFLITLAPARAELFLLGLVMGAGLEWAVNRQTLLRQYPPQPDSGPQAGQPLALLPWSLASAALALLGSQLDRLWLAVLAEPASFGAYVLIGTPLAAYLSLQMPIQRALLPRLSRSDTTRSAMRAVWQAHFLLALPCLLASPFAHGILALWLGTDSPVLVHAPILSGLLLALAAAILMGPAFLWLMHQQRWAHLIGAQLLTLMLQCLWFARAQPDTMLQTAVLAAFMPGFTGLMVLLTHPALRATLLPDRKQG